MRRLLAALFIAVLALAVLVVPAVEVSAHADQGVSAIVQVDAPVLAVDVGSLLTVAAYSDAALINTNGYSYVEATTAYVTRADDTYNIRAFSALGTATALNTTATNTESAIADGSVFHLLV